LAGPVWKKAKTDRLKKMPNVHFLGPISYHDLPELYNYFDIGIIPHQITKFTKSMNPLKMYEYLACGLPVVTTPVAGTDQFRKFIKVAETRTDFIAALKHYLADPGDQVEKEKRRQAVRGHSWQNRLDRMFKIIADARH